MKKTIYYLIVILAIMASKRVIAQSGTSPYLNSTHTYNVTMGGSSNSGSWVIANSSGVALATQPSFTTDKTGNTATMVIKWDASWATAGTSYKIIFTEAGTCTTERELPVTVTANTFYLTMSSDGSECHDLSGQILAANASGNTTLLFTANLNKDTGWTIDSWKFNFAVSISSGYTLQSVKLNSGSNLGTSGSYANQSVSGTSSTASIEVVVSGLVTSSADVTVTLSNGQAIKGTINTPDNGTGDKDQKLTVNPLPATSEISAD